MEASISRVSSDVVFLLCLRNHRCEKVEQILIGVAKSQRAISPRLSSRLLNEFARYRLELAELPVYILNRELDNSALLLMARSP
jgi:hypothetical protein